MSSTFLLQPCLIVLLGLAMAATAAEPNASQSPVDNLPPHITQLTSFG